MSAMPGGSSTENPCSESKNSVLIYFSSIFSHHPLVLILLGLLLGLVQTRWQHSFCIRYFYRKDRQVASRHIQYPVLYGAKTMPGRGVSASGRADFSEGICWDFPHSFRRPLLGRLGDVGVGVRSGAGREVDRHLFQGLHQVHGGHQRQRVHHQEGE